MSINTAREGHTYPAITYQVGREGVREFARAVKAQHRAHYELEAAAQLGYEDLVAPPTFGVVVSQRAEAAIIADPDVGIDFSRVVHADERFVHHRPITAGETVTAATTLQRIRIMGSGAMVTTVTEITHDDAPRTTVTSTLLVRTEEADA
jgi:acyl dehydratase